MSQFSTPGAPPSVEIKDSDPPSRIEITESRTPDAQPLKIKEREGEKTGTHLIGLKDGVSMDELIDDLLKAVKRDDAKIGPRWESIRTFSGTFGPESLKFLCSSSRVSYVEESGYVTMMAVQNDVPWGLARLSTQGDLQRQNPFKPGTPTMTMDYIHHYADQPFQPGHGVDIYVVDSGESCSE